MVSAFTTNSLVAQLPGTITPPPDYPYGIKIFGVVAVRYQITTGEHALTTVPFIVTVPTLGPTMLDYYRQFPRHDERSISTVRLKHGERAT